MKSTGLSFHHPFAFWSGCGAIVAGVLAHAPMFVCAADMGYQMVGMPMDGAMLGGMAAILLGLLLAMYGLMPRFDQIRRTRSSGDGLHFHLADHAKLNNEHWKLVGVLMLALTIDVMKPATLGFVMPGVANEYAISKQSAGMLALVALTGTTVGSVAWGRLADVFGRRAAILLSALMFIGTSICGAMPDFEWNLVMCFLMGASAGGLLPITFTLMAEVIPAVHRGWLLVALGAVGTSAGYLVAAGAASLLEPLFGWRVLWLLGLPTGAIILFLNRYIPESPRFLVGTGLAEQARAVLAKFAGMLDVQPQAASAVGAATAKQAGMRQIICGKYAGITCGLFLCGVAWGLVNFGFLLWLPTNLRSIGMDAGAASALLARSAIIALPGAIPVIWLYHRWSSIKSLVLLIVLTALTLCAFWLLYRNGTQSANAILIVTAILLVNAGGVIAMLIPYAAEIYPVHLRATGSGLIAASSKLGGILGAAGGVLGLFSNVAVSALLIAALLIMAALVLLRNGIDTRGRRLEDIQAAVTG